MIYIIGNYFDVRKYLYHIDVKVLNDISIGIANLEKSYGEGFDYTKVGGYSVVVSSAEEVTAFMQIANLDFNKCEWVTPIDNSDCISALFVVNNDFSISLYVPKFIAPKSILDEIF